MLLNGTMSNGRSMTDIYICNCFYKIFAELFGEYL
jgi:hypothetical protein